MRPSRAARAALTTALSLLFAGPLTAASAAEPAVTSFTTTARALGPITGTAAPFLAAPAINPNTSVGTLLLLRPGGVDPIDLLPLGDATAVAGGPDGNLWLARGTALRRQPVFPFSNAENFAVTGVPSGSQIGDLAPGPDGNVWFTMPGSGRVGVVFPSGSSTPIPITGGEPQSITEGPDGRLWFTSRTPAAIKRITINASSVDTLTAGLPADAAPDAITLGPDGNVWFTDAAAPRVGRVTPSGVITMFPAVVSRAIIAGPDGNLWLSGGSTISTSGVFTPRSLPVDTLAIGPDGNVWGVRDGTVSRLALGGQQFASAERIKVPATGTSGPADLYPSPITVSGLQGTVTKVTARLNGVYHPVANDLQVMLVGPGGQSAILMASVTTRPGDGFITAHPLTGESIGIAAGSPTADRRITSGRFAPVDPGFNLDFTPPAPAAPSGTLSQFAGTDPNGTWKLFVVDGGATPGSTGALVGGWSLDIETTGPPPTPTPTAPAPTPTATPTPVVTPTVPLAGDTLAPTLTLGKLGARRSLAALRRGLTVRVTPSESVTLQATLSAPARGSTSRTRFPLRLARSTRTLAAGATTRLTLTPARLRAPSSGFTVQLELVATDAAGNRSTLTRRLAITVPRRR